jgi:hypothetical protein
MMIRTSFSIVAPTRRYWRSLQFLLEQRCLDALKYQELNLDVLEFDASLRIAMRQTYPQQSYAYSGKRNRRRLAALFRVGSHVIHACCIPIMARFFLFCIFVEKFCYYYYLIPHCLKRLFRHHRSMYMNDRFNSVFLSRMNVIGQEK